MRFRLSRRAIGSSGAGTALRSRVKMGAGLGATAFLVARRRLGRDSFLVGLGAAGGGGGVGATPISPVPVITRFSPVGAAARRRTGWRGCSRRPSH